MNPVQKQLSHIADDIGQPPEQFCRRFNITIKELITKLVQATSIDDKELVQDLIAGCELL